MTLARQIIPGSIFLMTRRCLERRCFLAPDDDVNDLFAYLLAAMVARHGLVLLAAVQMSNHYHAVVHDPDGNAPAFMRDFHSLVGRGVNHLRGRSDAFWSADQASLVELTDGEAVLDRMAYVLCNPVAAGLVGKGRDWPGTRTAAGGCAAPVRTLRRPAGFLAEDGPLPEEVPWSIGVPPTHRHLSAREFADLLSERVRAVEETLTRSLADAGHRFPSPRELGKIRWNEAPPTPNGLFDANPLVASRDPELRRATLERHHAFRVAYRAALRAFQGGARQTVFPGGAWMLPRIYGLDAKPPPRAAWLDA